MNKRGFSLIELLATLVILGTVMGIATYSIISILNNSKEKNYNLLLDNIRGGAEVYYQECKYSKETILSMFDNVDAQAKSFCSNYQLPFTITLGKLVEYGYITGNEKDATGASKLINTKTSADISQCEIKIDYVNDKVVISSNSSDTNCPTEY